MGWFAAASCAASFESSELADLRVLEDPSRSSDLASELDFDFDVLEAFVDRDDLDSSDFEVLVEPEDSDFLAVDFEAVWARAGAGVVRANAKTEIIVRMAVVWLRMRIVMLDTSWDLRILVVSS